MHIIVGKPPCRVGEWQRMSGLTVVRRFLTQDSKKEDSKKEDSKKGKEKEKETPKTRQTQLEVNSGKQMMGKRAPSRHVAISGRRKEA